MGETIESIVRSLRNVMSFDSEPFLLSRDRLSALLDEAEQQRTRADAAESELRELREQMET